MRKVFKDADNELDPEKRKLLAEKLTSEKSKSFAGWTPDFIFVFDRLFGTEHLKWRCVYRSTLISIIGFSTFVWLTGYEEFHSSAGAPIWPLIVLAGFLVNAISDYFSLLETRTLLKTSLPVSIKILVDVPLTILIAVGWFSLFMWITGGYYIDNVMVTGYGEIFRIDLRDLVEGRENDPEVMLIRIVVATSFTTSIWLWLHGLAQLMIRGLSTAGYLMSWLNVKEKPLRAIGTTVNAFVLLFGVVLFPLFVIAS